MYKKIIASALAFAAVAAFGVAQVASANHSWGGYHWARTANPFTLKLGDNVSSSWDAYLTTASSDWSVSTVLDTTVVTGQAGSPRTCKAVTGTTQVCNASYGNNGWLGLASIWADSSGHITKGTAKMNDTYFNTTSYNTPAWKRLVMCQEVAHTFGLAHQDEAFGAPNLGSCMDYTNDPDGGGAYGPSNEHPNQHDYDQLVTIYGGHTDAYKTLAATVAKAANQVRDAFSVKDDEGDEVGDDFGHAIGHDGKGRANRFEKEVKGGKIITEVFWLPQ